MVKTNAHKAWLTPLGKPIAIIILLISGDKSTQQKDIDKAKEIWDKLKK